MDKASSDWDGNLEILLSWFDVLRDLEYSALITPLKHGFSHIPPTRDSVTVGRFSF